MLLHGFGDTPQSLSTQARALHEQGWTVRVPLLPGHGRTLEAFQASIAAEWIAASREAYASLRATHEHVSIVGLSMGGALAVLLAVEVPPRALVLLAPYLELSTSGRFWTTVWPIWSIWRAWIPGDAAASIHDPAARAESLGYGSASPWSLRQLRDVADAAATASSRLQAATLVIHSVTDYRIAEATARTSFARLGTTTKQLRWVEKSGHVITVDYDAALVTGAILEWLEQHA